MNNAPSHLTMFDHLGEDGFADFLNCLLSEIFSPSLIPFGKGKDGGRDATFEGIPRKYDKIDGYWIFQYKFHEIARVTNSKARASVKKDLLIEIEKILKLHKKPDCYIFITNAELWSGIFPEWYEAEVNEKFCNKFKHISIWDFTRLRSWLLNDPDLSEIREKFLPQTIPNLAAVDEILTQQLATPHPYSALKQIRAGISSQNFDWFLGKFKQFFPITDDFVRRELSDIIVSWLEKYPGRSEDVLACIEELFPPVDLQLRYQRHFKEKDIPLNSTAQIVLSLAKLFSERNNHKNLERLRNFIFSRFNLVCDSTQYLFVSPPEVYEALRKTIADLPNLVRDVVPELTRQFEQTYGEIYKGYELIGGGYLRSGNDFSLHDRAIVDTVITPILEKSYQNDPTITWNNIKDILERKMSKSNPTWLIRSTIPILLLRLSIQDTKEEAKSYLKKLIGSKKGLPPASDVIFSHLCTNVDNLEHSTLLELIDSDVAQFSIPSNIFVVILLFELMKRNNTHAKIIFLKLLENEKYLAYDNFYYNTIAHVSRIANNKELQREILSKLLSNNIWLEKADKYDTEEVFCTYYLLEAQKANGNLSFLNKFLQDSNDTYISLVFKALPNLAKEYPHQVISFIKTTLENKKPEEYIKEDYARAQVVEVANILAEKQLSKDALWIVDKFFSDPDPRIEEEGEFNYYKKINNGEDVSVITSVRGRIPWVLQKLSLQKEHILDVFKRTQTLLKDNNLYVIKEATIPLIEIVRRKQWLEEHGANNTALLHNILFKLLDNYSKYPAIAEYLLEIFNYYKELNEVEARQVLDLLGNIDKSAGFFIYYAVYRKNYFKNKGAFDPAQFEQILEQKILTGPEDLRSQLAWEFWNILDKQPREFVNVKKYVSIFVGSPFHNHTYDRLFRLIEEHTEEHFTECSEWFGALLDALLKHIEKHKGENLNLWVEHSNVVRIIAQNGTSEQYLKVLEKIVELAKKGIFVADLKKSFQAYCLTKKPEQKKVLKRLDELWIELTRQNPRLVTIKWKEE